MDVWVTVGVSVLGTLVMVAMAVVAWSVRRSDVLTYVKANSESQEKRIERLERDVEREERKREAAEERMSEFMQGIPAEYVHREDYMRFVMLIDSKQDKTFEVLQDLHQRSQSQETKLDQLVR